LAEATKPHRYEGRAVVVTYDEKRCIHAAECVHGLPAVFDLQAKPCVKPDGAGAGAVAVVVDRCPSGALQIEHRDGRVAPAPTANVATLTVDGPTYVRGDIVVVLPGGVTCVETRMALCRCGVSQNKPYCDGSHKAAGFRDPATLRMDVIAGAAANGGTLTVTPLPNGPVRCEGSLTLSGVDGRTTATGKAFLCRCGNSRNKPYCDGTHKKIGFIA
jgi:CDGSH-type Zn-finger protein/uncharacterized Fe-S cluster protein YjdI